MSRFFENTRGKSATLQRRLEHLQARIETRPDARSTPHDAQEASALRTAIAALDVVDEVRTLVVLLNDEHADPDEIDRRVDGLSDRLGL